MHAAVRHSPSFAAARLTLQPGEKVRAESGAMMATSAGVAVEGEGFVFDFSGPGWIMTQTRNPSALAAWIRQLMPGETGGASGGILDGLLGR